MNTSKQTSGKEIQTQKQLNNIAFLIPLEIFKYLPMKNFFSIRRISRDFYQFMEKSGEGMIVRDFLNQPASRFALNPSKNPVASEIVVATSLPVILDLAGIGISHFFEMGASGKLAGAFVVAIFLSAALMGECIMTLLQDKDAEPNIESSLENDLLLNGKRRLFLMKLITCLESWFNIFAIAVVGTIKNFSWSALDFYLIPGLLGAIVLISMFMKDLFDLTVDNGKSMIELENKKLPALRTDFLKQFRIMWEENPAKINSRYMENRETERSIGAISFKFFPEPKSSNTEIQPDKMEKEGLKINSFVGETSASIKMGISPNMF